MNKYLVGYKDILKGGYRVMDVYTRKDCNPEAEICLEDISKATTRIRFRDVDEMKQMAICLNNMIERWGNV